MTTGRVLHFLCLLHFLEIVLRQLLAPPSETGLVLALVVDLQAGKVRHSVSFSRKQIFLMQRAAKHGAKSAALWRHVGDNESCVSAPLEFRIKEPKMGALIHCLVRGGTRLLLEQEVQQFRRLHVVE